MSQNNDDTSASNKWVSSNAEEAFKYFETKRKTSFQRRKWMFWLFVTVFYAVLMRFHSIWKLAFTLCQCEHDQYLLFVNLSTGALCFQVLLLTKSSLQYVAPPANLGQNQLRVLGVQSGVEDSLLDQLFNSVSLFLSSLFSKLLGRKKSRKSAAPSTTITTTTSSATATSAAAAATPTLSSSTTTSGAAHATRRKPWEHPVHITQVAMPDLLTPLTPSTARNPSKTESLNTTATSSPYRSDYSTSKASLNISSGSHSNSFITPTRRISTSQSLQKFLREQSKVEQLEQLNRSADVSFTLGEASPMNDNVTQSMYGTVWDTNTSTSSNPFGARLNGSGFLPSAFPNYVSSLYNSRHSRHRDDDVYESSLAAAEALDELRITHVMQQWTENMRTWLSERLLEMLHKKINRANALMRQMQALGLLCERPLIGDAARLLQELRQSYTQTQTQPTTTFMFAPSAQTQQQQQQNQLNKQNLSYLNDRVWIESFLSIAGTEESREYVVERIKQLATGGFLSEYTWNGGGTFKDRPWSPELSLPNDSELVFHLFCTFLDEKMPPDPRSSRSFTANHVTDSLTVKDEKRFDVVIFHNRNIRAPHFKVLFNKRVYETLGGRNTLFHALILFLFLVKRFKEGYVGSVDLEAKSIRLLSGVLQPDP